MADEGTLEALQAENAQFKQRIAELEQRLARERAESEEALQRSEAQLRETIEQQERLIATIREISTPVIPVHDEIIVLPLVGTIDSARSAQIMETLLTGVQQFVAEIVIIDITGVSVVDTSVANHLLQAARAATLLGAHCVLVGISPEVAQAMVHLGVNLNTLTTCSNLQAGIEFALERLGKQIVNREVQVRRTGSGQLGGLLRPEL